MALRFVLLAAALAIAGLAAAQQTESPNGIFLVAKPGLVDPNFRQTVVLVTQAQDYSTVGVIINRPTNLRLDRFLRDDSPSARYRDALFFGGPVMPQVIVALFRSDSAPEAPAFHVLKGLYLSLHPENLRRLLESSSARYRLYAGFSGWAPQQLQSEIQREGWYVLPADADTIFRKNMEGVWQELVQRAEKRPIAWTVDPRK
ncbi:MAG: YqgE/AlgH family protein [Burkholderiales bacterium]